MIKQTKNQSSSENFFTYFLYIVNGFLLLISVFLFLQIKNITSRLENIEKIINPQPQQQAQTKVTLDQVKKLFTSGFIHFGDGSKKLLIVEISDPSCPFCHIASGENPQLAKEAGARFQYQSEGGSYVPPVPEFRKLINEGKASFAFLFANGHGNGKLAAEALYCAYEKGKFWEVHDKLMTNEGYKLLNENITNDRTKAEELANFLASAIDPQFLTNCLKSAKYEKNLTRDEQLAPSLGFRGTPHFIINTTLFQGAYSYTDMKSEIEKYL